MPGWMSLENPEERAARQEIQLYAPRTKYRPTLAGLIALAVSLGGGAYGGFFAGLAVETTRREVELLESARKLDQVAARFPSLMVRPEPPIRAIPTECPRCRFLFWAVPGKTGQVGELKP